MEFELSYTPEQQAFRKEVQSFLEEHVPRDLGDPATLESLPFTEYAAQYHGYYLKRFEFGRKLGGRGWLYPTYPTEYGGGALSIDLAIIIEEELDSVGLGLPPYHNGGATHAAASILVWGNEEQKKHFLPPIVRGDAVLWQLLTEPSVGSDPASLQTNAMQDGDEYVINGEKTFVGGAHGATWYWTIARTDPKGKRHENLSWFLISPDLPGISTAPMELLTTVTEDPGVAAGIKHSVYFENVRVPSFNLIGGENNGWKVASTHLESEHGGRGSIRRNLILDRFFEYCRVNHRNGQPLSKDPAVQELLVEAYIDAEIGRLLALRNYWLNHANQPRSYEGSQASMYRKLAGVRIAKVILKALGPYALLNDPEWDQSSGHMELHQRSSIVSLHPGGTTEIQKMIVARRLGIGRTVREEAARLV